MCRVNHFFLACCLIKECYYAIIVVVRAGVEREEGLPLLARLCEKPRTRGEHNALDAATVTRDGMWRHPSCSVLFGMSPLCLQRSKSDSTLNGEEVIHLRLLLTIRSRRL